MTRNRSWVIADRTSDAWKIGVFEFVEESYRLVGTDGKIYCPCGRCDNQERLNSEEVKRHIIWWGVNQAYFMGDWYLHGEELSAKKVKRSRDCSISDVFVDEEVLQEVDDMTGLLRDVSRIPMPPRGSEVTKFYERVKEEIAEKNLDNRVDHPHPNHHTILAAELENRALPDDFDIWVKGVMDKKGVVDVASQMIINRFNEKVIEIINEDESTPESQRPTSTPRQRAWDFVNDEKNSAKHGHRLGKGSGPTITMLLGGRKMQKFVNEEMITKLTITQQELQMTKEDLATTQLKLKANEDKLKANEDKLQATEDKMAKMQAFLEAKFGYVDKS